MNADVEGVARERRAAASALARRGVAGAPELVRVGANVVFRSGPTLVRVGDCSPETSQQVALVRWLTDQGVRVPRPLAEEMVIDGMSVSLWEYIESADRPIDFRRYGEVIRSLHEFSVQQVAAHAQLPFCADATWLDMSANLQLAAAAGVVDDSDIEILAREIERLGDWRALARQEDSVVCHGDVQPSNAVMAADGLVVLDWDSICLGPRAWDHAALLTWSDRWGGAPGVYAEFADGYGADLSGSVLARLLARVRLLAPTINMIAKGAASTACAEEARHRMRFWRGEPDLPAWHPQ